MTEQVIEWNHDYQKIFGINVDNIWKEVQFSKTLFICIIRFNKKYNDYRNIKHSFKKPMQF